MRRQYAAFSMMIGLPLLAGVALPAIASSGPAPAAPAVGKAAPSMSEADRGKAAEAATETCIVAKSKGSTANDDNYPGLAKHTARRTRRQNKEECRKGPH